MTPVVDLKSKKREGLICTCFIVKISRQLGVQTRVRGFRKFNGCRHVDKSPDVYLFDSYQLWSKGTNFEKVVRF